MSFTRETPAQQRARRAKSRRATNHNLAQRVKNASAATMQGGVSGEAVEKEQASQSAAYMAAVRNLGYCVRCGRTCRPQFCHADMGKGTGIKTDVRRGWAGCGRWAPDDPGCHYIVGTSGTLSKEERRAEDERLGVLTRAAVEAAGTWPKNLGRWDEMTRPRFAPPIRHRAPKVWHAGAVILDSQVFSEADATTIVNKVRIAEQRLRDGTAESDHFIRLGCAINVASVRAEEVSVGLIGALDDAGKALTACQDRRDRMGRYGMSGPGLLALGVGVDVYEALLRASSPKQMQAAEAEVIRRLDLRGTQERKRCA